MMNKFEFDDNNLEKTFKEFMKYIAPEHIEYAKSNPEEMCRLLWWTNGYLRRHLERTEIYD